MKLSAAEAVNRAIHFGFPQRHCQRMVNGLEWNSEQHEVLQIIEPTIRSGGIVVLHGVRGNGKTQIASGLGYEWWLHGYHLKRGKARYWTLPELLASQKRSFTISTTEKQPLLLARECGFLVLDEIDTDQSSEHDKRELRDLIDARYRAADKPTFFLTNVKPDCLDEALDYSILDRIREDGKIIQLHGTSFRASGTNRSVK